MTKATPRILKVLPRVFVCVAVGSVALFREKVSPSGYSSLGLGAVRDEGVESVQVSMCHL